MAFVPVSKEDLVKIDVYTKLLDGDYGKEYDFSKGNVSEYTRACMRAYDEKKYKIQEKPAGIIRRKTLEGELIKCVKDFNEATKLKRRLKIDRKALAFVKRCCKGKTGFVKAYYAMYKWLTGRQVVYIS